MANLNPPPDLLTFQTMYLCGVAYMADPVLMPVEIEKAQLPPIAAGCSTNGLPNFAALAHRSIPRPAATGRATRLAHRIASFHHSGVDQFPLPSAL